MWNLLKAGLLRKKESGIPDAEEYAEYERSYKPWVARVMFSYGEKTNEKRNMGMPKKTPGLHTG
ncbi:MAG: hypothetical protein LBQ42_04175 [Synergistaceae bacterium]|nr:hypothetical protein [Synergistaceae bacterium]